jgi:hypothetical protein
MVDQISLSGRKLLLVIRHQTAKSAKYSEATVQRNSIRGLQFKRTTQRRGLPPDLDGVNYARSLKLTKAKRLKNGDLTLVLSGTKAF